MIALLLAALTLAQDNGKYEVTLRLPPAGLHAREEMEIELHIADKTRPDPLTNFAPVIRALVDARIDMPAMPSMPVYREQAHAEGVPGDYGVHPTFAHGGDYRLRLSIKPPADTPFEVEFTLKVADEAEARKRKPLPPRYTVELTATPKHPKAGEPADLRFVFRDRDNPKSVLNAFETVHESLFHLIIVRSDLGAFAHEHPEKQPDGSFKLRYQFPARGDYRLFADVAPVGAGSQILTAAVSAGPNLQKFNLRDADRTRRRQVENTIVSLASEASPSKKTFTIPVTILDATTGQPPNDLEPYLGVKGHLLLVHEDGATFVHSHPAETADLQFLTRFPKPGLYRGWIQFKRAGKILTADFILEATP